MNACQMNTGVSYGTELITLLGFSSRYEMHQEDPVSGDKVIAHAVENEALISSQMSAWQAYGGNRGLMGCSADSPRHLDPP